MYGELKNCCDFQDRVKWQPSGEPIQAYPPRALCCLPRAGRHRRAAVSSPILSLITKSPDKQSPHRNCERREWDKKTHFYLLSSIMPTAIRAKPANSINAKQIKVTNPS